MNNESLKTYKEINSDLNDKFETVYCNIIDDTLDRIDYLKQKLINNGENLSKANKENSTYMERLLTEFRLTKKRLKNLKEFEEAHFSFLPRNKETIENLGINLREKLSLIKHYRDKTGILVSDNKIGINEIKKRFIDLKEFFKERDEEVQNNFDISFALAKYHKKCSKPFKVHKKPEKNEIKDLLNKHNHYPLPNIVSNQKFNITKKYLDMRYLINFNTKIDIASNDIFQNKNQKK